MNSCRSCIHMAWTSTADGMTSHCSALKDQPPEFPNVEGCVVFASFEVAP